MAENIMKITNLSSSYGNIKALKSIDIEINKGEIVSLLGANGAGKSTLMKSILGMVHIDEGSILYKGQELVGKKEPRDRTHGHFSGARGPQDLY